MGQLRRGRQMGLVLEMYGALGESRNAPDDFASVSKR